MPSPLWEAARDNLVCRHWAAHCLMVYFTARFMIHLKMQQVFASYYIVYVGIAVASVTAPAFDKLAVGTAAFWFGFAAALILLVLVTYRYVNFKQVPEPAQPLFCIYTAPVSLCLAGYIPVRAVKVTGAGPVYDDSQLSHLHCGAYKDTGIPEDEVLSQLCRLYLPLCHYSHWA